MTVLDAWLYGTRVARIRSARPDRAELTFSTDALDRWGVNSSVVSGLLPLSATPPPPSRVTAWLRGLLPEGRARTQLALDAGVDADDAVAFLAVYGRDTAGALVLVPEGEEAEPQGHLRRLTEKDIAALLDEAALDGAADQLTSLAGLETKIVLTRTPDGWASPVGRPPSTHIVKLSRPAGSLSADLVDTEVAALELARRCGLTTVDAGIAWFDGRRAIVVERYDRVVAADGSVSRIHQEDGAQVLGLSTDDPDRKFQWGRPLPSLRALARSLIAMGDVRPTGLLALTTFNLAIGNTDAHAKNISVVHRVDGSTELAPAYDVAMHLHHAHAGRRFAMDVAGITDITEIGAADLVTEARSWGLTARDATVAVRRTLEQLDAALDAVDRDAHPGVSDEAWSTVRTRTRSLLADAPRATARTRAAGSTGPTRREPKGTPTGGRFAPARETAADA